MRIGDAAAAAGTTPRALRFYETNGLLPPTAAHVLAIAASATFRLKIGFGVMVLALRGPAWAAKQAATLQVLSGGRVILGVSAGGDLHGNAAG
jgi:alkanesulfonate monooxygenase SsuD/methylene tetrahydromethanopterin reductase-like flavin-dependent oxidoreductase (luciferase family)